MLDLSVKRCVFCDNNKLIIFNYKAYNDCYQHYNCLKCSDQFQLYEVVITWNYIANRISWCHLYVGDFHISHQFKSNTTVIRNENREDICMQFSGFAITPSNVKEKLKTILTFR